MRPNLERWSKIKRLCAALLLVQENWQSLELSPEQVTGDDVEVAGIDGADVVHWNVLVLQWNQVDGLNQMN